MLVVAGICLVLIIYFNLRFMGSQQERFAQRVGDGSEHYEQYYPNMYGDDEISPENYSEGRPLILIFWSSWSGRSEEALTDLHRRYTEATTETAVITAAVKDNPQHAGEIRDAIQFPFLIVDGTEHYNEIRLPGLPSLIAFNADGSLFGARLGFTGTKDYDFLNELLNPEDD